ncbi:hypothetical protein HQ584_09280, partial [Patescibacteria group bacterium]|nr:hypothetical protein [Patescibacteria group bacterium]
MYIFVNIVVVIMLEVINTKEREKKMLYIIVPIHSELKSIWKKMLKITKHTFPKAKIIRIMDTESRGKGWAVRKGLERALRLSQHDNDLFAYIDGDLDIHPVMLKRLRKKIKDYDIVVGKKRLKNIPIMRKLITFISRIYIEKMFKIGVDTQTGIKIFKKKAITLVKRNGFLFDIAMLK